LSFPVDLSGDPRSVDDRTPRGHARRGWSQGVDLRRHLGHNWRRSTQLASEELGDGTMEGPKGITTLVFAGTAIAIVLAFIVV